jgi:hypothetical protein
LWEFRKLQGEVISLRSSTQLENLLSLRLQPANTSNLILFSHTLLNAVNIVKKPLVPLVGTAMNGHCFWLELKWLQSSLYLPVNLR